MMHEKIDTSVSRLVCVFLLLAASGCSWVDSTGAQSPAVGSSVTAASTFRNAEPVAILEETSFTGALEGEGAELTNWNWILEDTDVNAQCNSINGFDTNLSANELSSACSNANECTVAIDESSGDGATRFTLQMPTLSAPVALSYQLSTTREDGTLLTRQQLVCGLSMNEAPLANDDEYLSPANELRIVNAQDADSLLRNDQDDNDVRNQPLRVLTTPVTSPLYAQQFALDSEGGFIYQPIENLPESDTGFVEDSFVYAVTDGLHTVNATALIRIIDGNRGPEIFLQLPDVTIQASSPGNTVAPEQINLSQHFFDPDVDALSFAISPNALPADSQIATIQNQLLSLQASEDEVGEWLIEIVATDGLEFSSDTFTLTVLSGLEDVDDKDNREPSVTDIRNRIVRNTFSYDVSGFFTDADDDVLSFTAAGLPRNIVISESGVITGTSSNSNQGTWFIQVTADDNRGGSVTDGFLLVIR